MTQILGFFIGICLFIGGIIGGIYIAFWVMFIGGIVDIINAVKASPVDAYLIGVGFLKFVFAGTAGWLTFWICTIIATFFFSTGE